VDPAPDGPAATSTAAVRASPAATARRRCRPARRGRHRPPRTRSGAK
jgi:hypothetical protein